MISSSCSPNNNNIIINATADAASAAATQEEEERGPYRHNFNTLTFMRNNYYGNGCGSTIGQEDTAIQITKQQQQSQQHLYNHHFSSAAASAATTESFSQNKQQSSNNHQQPHRHIIIPKRNHNTTYTSSTIKPNRSDSLLDDQQKHHKHPKHSWQLQANDDIADATKTIPRHSATFSGCSSETMTNTTTNENNIHDTDAGGADAVINTYSCGDVELSSVSPLPNNVSTYEKYKSIDRTVQMLNIKDKRSIFKSMREISMILQQKQCERDAIHFILPRYGLTVGEFATWYMLNGGSSSHGSSSSSSGITDNHHHSVDEDVMMIDDNQVVA